MTWLTPWRRAALAALLAAASVQANADDAARARKIVADSRVTLAHFNASPTQRMALLALPGASAIVIFPHVVSAAFIVGGSGADGVLFVRDLQSGHWIGPAFYRLVSGSVGLQAGGSSAEVVMIVNSTGALRSLYKGHLRLGIDASIAIGHGGGAGSAITADVDSYALSKGLVAGIALDGSRLSVRAPLNTAWYGRPATPAQILVDREVSNPDSVPLARDIENLAP
jgi:lipid-binding SYLF domain-containing protein